MTAPYGVTDQDDFLNGALELQSYSGSRGRASSGSPSDRTESPNRVRTIHWGPRTLDLDILMYDDLVLDTPELHVPHIEMHLRDFVLIPMNQIAHGRGIH